MQIKKLTITPIGFQTQKEIYKNINTSTAGNLIKGRLYQANGYETKIPCSLRKVPKKLKDLYGINTQTMVLNIRKFVYDA